MSDPTQSSAPEPDKPAWKKLTTRKIWVLPVWAYVLIAFIVIGAFSGGGDTTDDQTATEPEPTVAPTAEPTAEPTVAPTAEPAAPEPTATPKPEPEPTATESPVGLSPAEMMRAFTPLVMAQAGYPMSSTGEVFWEVADLELHDEIGLGFCDSVRESSFEVAALLLYEDTVGLLEAFGVEPGFESVGAILGSYVGAYCPDEMS
ncbi:hypothetical protein N9I50_00745 [bacterium]|nr:hypothetical protein [bacterium]